MAKSDVVPTNALAARAARIKNALAAVASAFGAALFASLVKAALLPEPVTLLTAAVASLLVGVLYGALIGVRRSTRQLRTATERPREDYAERLSKLTSALHSTSREVDTILSELAAVARDRESAVSKLEGDLAQLESREQELQRRINELSNVPIAVAEHFAALTAQGEKRSARRDYLLFGLGVVLSTLISIIFFLLQGH